MNTDTDLEVDRYNEATSFAGAGFSLEELQGAMRQYNPQTKRNDIMTELSAGGYVKVGEEELPQPTAMVNAPMQPGQTPNDRFLQMQKSTNEYASQPGAFDEFVPEVVKAIFDGGIVSPAKLIEDNITGKTGGLQFQIVNPQTGEFEPRLRIVSAEERQALDAQMQAGEAPYAYDFERLVKESETAGVGAQFGRGMAQFLAAFAGVGKVFNIGKGTLNLTARSGASGFLAFKGDEGRLTDLLVEIGAPEFLILDFLKTDPSDPDYIGRSKTLIEELALGGIVETALLAKNFGKTFRSIKDGDVPAEELDAAVKEGNNGLKGIMQTVVDRINQPGQMPTVSSFGVQPPNLKASSVVLTDIPHPLTNRAREIADARIARQQAQADANPEPGKKPKKIGKRIKIEDLATLFDEDHLTRNGRKLDPTSPDDQLVAAKELAAEIDLQMTQADSGAGWYDADVLKTFEMMAKIPGLERIQNDETARVIWSAMAAPTSIGQLVKNNTRAAVAAALQYFRTGKFPVDAPLAGATTEGIPAAGWGVKQKSVEPGMRIIASLIDKYGEEGFVDWWLSPHTKKELTQARLDAGLKGPPSGVSGKADSVHLGAMVLGDKTGRFSLNINGYEGTTKDVWYSRSYNRMFGQMFGAIDPKTGEPVVQAGPRNQVERREMEAFNKLVIDNTKLKGLSEADAQAILWFYEQGLYTRLGVPSRPGSFSEGVGEVHGTLGIRSTVRGSDGTEVEVEPREEVDGFRSVSKGQRAVRGNRRFEELNSSEVDGGSPGPYATGSTTDDGRNGLLTLEPNPGTLEKYQNAGLNLPKLNEVSPAESSQAYHNDMVVAMREHKYGAQVEIKSPEDLSGYRLFRTENEGGFAIKPDGDIVAVFAGKAEPRGGSYALLQAAVQQGGVKLDAFNTMLPRIYEQVGFKPVARLAWNDEFAPPGWDKSTFAKFNNGEPDVVFFVYDPDYFGDIKMDDVPVFNDYDAAAAAQDAALK